MVVRCDITLALTPTGTPGPSLPFARALGLVSSCLCVVSLAITLVLTLTRARARAITLKIILTLTRVITHPRARDRGRRQTFNRLRDRNCARVRSLTRARAHPRAHARASYRALTLAHMRMISLALTHTSLVRITGTIDTGRGMYLDPCVYTNSYSYLSLYCGSCCLHCSRSCTTPAPWYTLTHNRVHTATLTIALTNQIPLVHGLHITLAITFTRMHNLTRASTLL